MAIKERTDWKMTAGIWRRERDAYREALEWCSGSPSFAPGGEARKGWMKICSPLLAVPANAKGRMRK